jgi:hypothetical protein
MTEFLIAFGSALVGTVCGVIVGVWSAAKWIKNEEKNGYR